MARHTRRLIAWIGGGVLALLLLVALAVLVLVWLVDPNVWRARIAQSAANALGRQVQLGGDLHWDIGWNIGIASEGGSIANAPGFDATPFARWQHSKFGLNTRALLGKRIEIDQLAIDGLKIHLQRNAAGEGNWIFTPATASGAATQKPIALRIGSLQLRHSQLTFTDARDAPTSWQLDDVTLDVTLPPDLNAPRRELRGLDARARISGGPLPNAGVLVAFKAASLTHDATTSTLEVPAIDAHWGNADLSGRLHAVAAGQFTAQGKAAVHVPSLRSMLADLQINPPPMADPRTLGRLDINAAFDLQGSSLALTDLQVVLDDTRLGGTVSVAQFTPLALRFDLDGDAVDFDRYLEPAGHKGKPFELPLAQLKALNMQGELRMKSATMMGASASELHIDVE